MQHLPAAAKAASVIVAGRWQPLEISEKNEKLKKVGSAKSSRKIWRKKIC